MNIIEQIGVAIVVTLECNVSVIAHFYSEQDAHEGAMRLRYPNDPARAMLHADSVKRFNNLKALISAAADVCR